MRDRDGGNDSRKVRVGLVGHCVPDMYLLKNVVERAVPGVEIVRINSDEVLRACLSSQGVLLINRVLDGEFTSTDGQALVREIGSRATPRPVVLLVSNLAAAQAKAEADGALPGFGKGELLSEQTKSRLQAAVHAASSATT